MSFVLEYFQSLHHFAQKERIRPSFLLSPQHAEPMCYLLRHQPHTTVAAGLPHNYPPGRWQALNGVNA